MLFIMLTPQSWVWEEWCKQSMEIIIKLRLYYFKRI